MRRASRNFLRATASTKSEPYSFRSSATRRAAASAVTRGPAAVSTRRSSSERKARAVRRPRSVRVSKTSGSALRPRSRTRSRPRAWRRVAARGVVGGEEARDGRTAQLGEGGVVGVGRDGAQEEDVVARPGAQDVVEEAAEGGFGGLAVVDGKGEELRELGGAVAALDAAGELARGLGGVALDEGAGVAREAAGLAGEAVEDARLGGGAGRGAEAGAFGLVEEGVDLVGGELLRAEEVGDVERDEAVRGEEGDGGRVGDRLFHAVSGAVVLGDLAFGEGAGEDLRDAARRLGDEPLVVAEDGEDRGKRGARGGREERREGAERVAAHGGSRRIRAGPCPASPGTRGSASPTERPRAASPGRRPGSGRRRRRCPARSAGAPAR